MSFKNHILQISNRLQPLHLFGCQKEDAKGFFSSIWKVFLHCELVSVSSQHAEKFRNDASSQRLTFQNKSQKKTFASSEKTQKRVFCCSRFEICSISYYECCCETSDIGTVFTLSPCTLFFWYVCVPNRPF